MLLDINCRFYAHEVCLAEQRGSAVQDKEVSVLGSSFNSRLMKS